MLVNSHLRRTRNPDFILSTMWVCQAVLRSLLRVFRAVPLPPALTLPLPLNPTPPPASIHGNRARGFPKHLARGFDVRRAMATATGWRASVSVATVSLRLLLSYLSSPSCQLTQLCVGYTDLFIYFYYFQAFILCNKESCFFQYTTHTAVDHQVYCSSTFTIYFIRNIYKKCQDEGYMSSISSSFIHWWLNLYHQSINCLKGSTYGPSNPRKVKLKNETNAQVPQNTVLLIATRIQIRLFFS